MLPGSCPEGDRLSAGAGGNSGGWGFSCCDDPKSLRGVEGLESKFRVSKIKGSGF